MQDYFKRKEWERGEKREGGSEKEERRGRLALGSNPLQGSVRA